VPLDSLERMAMTIVTDVQNVLDDYWRHLKTRRRNLPTEQESLEGYRARVDSPADT
jgi:hypothetical protein